MKAKYRKTDWLVPFNSPHFAGKEIKYIQKAYQINQFSGNGIFTKNCQGLIEKQLKVKKTLLTHSCTAALEMIAILGNFKAGDEVIMPSFTFVSTANAFVLRGIIPVFVDIRPDTLNIDEKLIENAITKRTRAIIVVHYAGVACEMDKIRIVAKKHKLMLFEDAAQAYLSKYKGKYLGGLGDLSAVSFHETKNVISGEGGALLVNNSKYFERANIIWEKGTNRDKFIKGQVDKYTWVDIGSSYLPGEITAAFLLSQLEKSREITKKRLTIWNRYNRLLKDLEIREKIKRPLVPEYVQHNAHMYYLVTPNVKVRDGLIRYLKDKSILSVFHYIPLHNSPAGKKFGKHSGKMLVTNRISQTLLRLPLFYDMNFDQVDYIVDKVYEYFKR